MLDESEDLICTFQRSSSMPLLCKPTLVKSKLRRAVTDSPHSLNNIIEVGTVGGGWKGRHAQNSAYLPTVMEIGNIRQPPNLQIYCTRE